MKRIQETRVENAFQVETIVSLLPGRRLKKLRAPGRLEDGVVYEFWQLFLLESGQYTCQIEDCEPGLMRPKQLLICEPRKIRYSLANNEAVASIINIRCASPLLKQMKNRIFSLDGPELDMVRQILDMGSTVFQWLPEDAPLAGQEPLPGTTDWQLQLLKNQIELLLIRLYDRFCREQPATLSGKRENSYEAKFSRVRQFLREHLGERLTLADICRETGFSGSTLKRIFESQAECGVIHYFLTMKITEAKRLLGDTDMTVTEIAEALGFSSVHYFSRIFKQFTGRNPNSFR